MAQLPIFGRGKINALNGTPFDAVLTVDQAFAEEAAQPTVPTGEKVIVADTAANIEALTPIDLFDFGAISVSRIVVSDLDGVGPLTLEDGYKYTVTGPVSSGETITFAFPDIKLTFDDTADMNGTIDGFDASGEIRLKDVAYDPNGSANLLPANVLEVTENGANYFLQFNSLQDFTNEFFHLSPDAHGGTDITVSTTPCYCRGTHIETPHGATARRRAQDRRPGDDSLRRGAADQMDRPAQLRRPLHLGTQGYSAGLHQGRCARRQHAAARSVDFAAPRHVSSPAMTARSPKGVLIEAKDLVNGTFDRAGRARRQGRVFPYRARDARRDRRRRRAVGNLPRRRQPRHVPQRPGVPCALSAVPRRSAAQYCAPRLQDGYEVDAVRRRIGRRHVHAGVALAS